MLMDSIRRFWIHPPSCSLPPAPSLLLPPSYSLAVSNMKNKTMILPLLSFPSFIIPSLWLSCIASLFFHKILCHVISLYFGGYNCDTVPVVSFYPPQLPYFSGRKWNELDTLSTIGVAVTSPPIARM